MSTRVRHPSDSLRMWIGQKPFEGHGLFARVTPVEQFHLVLDSSVLQRDLRYLIRHAKRLTATGENLRTAIMETIDAGVVVAYVPPLALHEIEKYLPNMAADVGGDTNVARAIWSGYRERLIVLEPIREHRHPELERRDINDLPFYAVFREASGEALLTADNHLLDTINEALTAEELTSLLREYTRQKAVALGASGQIYAGAFAIGHISSLFVRATKAGVAAFNRLPWWAQIGIVAGGFWVATRPGVKKWVSESWTVVSTMAERVLPQLPAVIAEVAIAEQAAEAAHAQLRQRVRKPKRLGLRGALLRVAKEAGVALNVNELARRVLAAGYQTRAKRFVDYVARHLARDPMFERTIGGWRLRARDSSGVVSRILSPP